MAELRRLRHLAGRLHLGLPHPRHHAVQQDVHREGQGGRQEGSSGKTSRNNLFKVIDAVVQWLAPLLHSWEVMGSVPPKVNRIRLGTTECKRRLLDDITSPPKFSGNAWGWWRRNSAFLETGQISERLWSPSWCSYSLQRAGVPNLNILTLVLSHSWKSRLENLALRH